MTHPTNPPAEAAMQPVWAVVTNDDGVVFSRSHDEAHLRNLWVANVVANKFRISELMERAEHDRKMAAKDEEIEKLRAVVEVAVSADAKLKQMFGAQEKQRRQHGKIDSTPRDIFESWVNDLADDARAALQPEKKV